MTGTVYLVGAGPGAPDLLTLRAARLLQQADIVFYDALVHPDTVLLADKAQRIAVGKRCGRHSTAQRFINKRLVDAARKYATVVRLKGGDPMVFGRAHEEIEVLRAANIAFSIVPGVTAALAASADLQIPLTQRGQNRSLTFVTPRQASDGCENHWVNNVLATDTAAIYMGIGQAAEISAALLNAGCPAQTPVAVVENASLPDVRRLFTTLEELPHIAHLTITGPALILLGSQFVCSRTDSSSVESPGNPGRAINQ
nr:protein of unknown function (DUF4218) [uncultured bacterium]